MSKTIKQIADELGVSKQAIQKRLSREPLLSSVAPYISTVSGTKYIAVDGENLIKSAFNKNGIDTTSIDMSIDNNNTSIDKSIPVSIDENTASIPKSIDKNEPSIHESIDKRGISIDENKPYTPESIDKSDLEKNVKEFETLKAKIGELETANVELLKKAKDIDSLTDKCKELEKNCEVLETELSEKKNYISTLEADKDKASYDIDDLKNQLKEKEASAKEDREKDRQERQTILTRLWKTEDEKKALEIELNEYKALASSDTQPQPEPQAKIGFFKRLFGKRS